MGLSGIGPTSLLLVLLIVVLLFGTKKLRNMGGDIGAAVKNFRKGASGDSEEESSQDKLEK